MMLTSTQFLNINYGKESDSDIYQYYKPYINVFIKSI